MKRQIWTPDQLLAWIKQEKVNKTFKSSDLVAHFKMSRQTAARLLRKLVEQGILVKKGATLGATYRLRAKNETLNKTTSIHLTKVLKGLEEHKVFDEIDLRLNLEKLLPENVFRIAYYAFGEMLNNAIDHSDSKNAIIHVEIENGRFQFKIRDTGIGIFKRIRLGFKLEDTQEAVEHLIKGKQTTYPEAHTGQGIFFTSKIADFFTIRSEKFCLKFDNINEDLRLEDTRPIKGTEIFFSIKTLTRKTLKALFEKYANEDFDFDRTTYPIILLEQNGTLSRSQARRLVVGLEKFDRVIFDFSKVKELGQGFADEIFRIHQNRYPKQVLEVRNANPAVDFMIKRAYREPGHEKK